MSDSEQPKPSGARKKPETAIHAKRWQSAELLGEAREALIEHGGDLYRLRVTSNNKLILTK